MKIPVFKIITAASLAGIIMLTTACGNNAQRTEPETEQTTLIEDVVAEVTTVEEPDSTVTQAPVEVTTVSVTEPTSTADEVSEPESTTESAVPSTPEEIVALFNESANKIKTDAILVVKNYEKRSVNEEHVSIPKAIESVAGSMLKTFMKDDLNPIAYSTKEEIRTDFIVPNQNYVSRLKASDVESALCKDTGKTYEIYFKLKTSVNPSAGVGVGSVCDVIETYDVANGPAFIEEFSTKYYNCEVKAVYNKESGRITHVNYKTPLILNLKVSLMGTHSGSIGFTFEKDYSITY